MKNQSVEDIEKNSYTYWSWFRLSFTLFSLYLMGDVFYRWDGFRYYSSFAEFLPAVALISILWSIVAALTACLAWLLSMIFNSLSKITKRKILTEHFLLFICLLLFFTTLTWAGKRYVFNYELIIQTKKIIFLGIIPAAIFVSWLFRNQTEHIIRWMNNIHGFITPLVWLFGIFVLLSIPIVAYHAWIKEPEDIVLQEFVNRSIIDTSRPNILLITFDAMTAEDMSVYGYHRPTTPFIAKWAESSYFFRRAEAESNSTNPTTASLMTGKRLWTHQVYHQMGSKPVRIDTESLPLMLKRNGYYNMAFIANMYASVNNLGVGKRFDVAPSVIQFQKTISGFSWWLGKIDNVLYKLFSNKIRLYDWLLKEDFIFGKFLNFISRDFEQTNVPPDMVFHNFLKSVNNDPSNPYFAWLHVMPPHNPYLPPKDYMGMFEPSPKLRSYKSQRGLLVRKFDQKTANIARGRYDEFIRYCDRQLEDFIAELEKRGMTKNTVIILSADHGESFEHEFMGHNGTRLYEQLTHIPLIIKVPGQQKGKIINDLVEQIDIPATILDLAHISVPSWMEGQSLIPLMRGEERPPQPVFSGFFENNYGHSNEIINGTVAIWEGDYKLIHYLGNEKSLLFNLKEDPAELTNLFEKESETGERLLNLIKDNLKEANKRILVKQ